MSAHDNDRGWADFQAHGAPGRSPKPRILSIVARAFLVDARSLAARGMGFALDPLGAADLEIAAANLEAAARKLRAAAQHESEIRKADKT